MKINSFYTANSLKVSFYEKLSVFRHHGHGHVMSRSTRTQGITNYDMLSQGMYYCMESVLLYGECITVWRVYGECMESVWRVYYCVESVWRVYYCM